MNTGDPVGPSCKSEKIDTFLGKEKTVRKRTPILDLSGLYELKNLNETLYVEFVLEKCTSNLPKITSWLM